MFFRKNLVSWVVVIDLLFVSIISGWVVVILVFSISIGMDNTYLCGRIAHPCGGGVVFPDHGRYKEIVYCMMHA